MTLRTMAIIIVLSLLCAAQALAAAETGPKQEFINELSDLRVKKAALMDGYREDVRKLNKESEAKIDEFKVEFRKSRDAVLADKDAKYKKLTADYNAAIKPLLKREEELIPMAGSDMREDFVKTKRD